MPRPKLLARPGSRVAVIVILIVVVVGGGAAWYWYAHYYQPQHFYNTSIKKANEVLKNGSYSDFGNEVTVLTSQIIQFKKPAQKEAAYRTLAQLDDTLNNQIAALDAYQQAESFGQTTDLSQILRIARLAETNNNRQLAITYYQRALDVYHANQSAYANYPPEYVNSWQQSITALQKGNK